MLLCVSFGLKHAGLGSTCSLLTLAIVYCVSFLTCYRANYWKKRGLALTPTKYGVSFGRSFLNQGGALLHVYTDGSILVTHGGLEMGQGLHTKMVQVCSRCLGIPSDMVFISGTSTDTVPNSSPSAASVSTDLYGMAVKVCIKILVLRKMLYAFRDPIDTTLIS